MGCEPGIPILCSVDYDPALRCDKRPEAGENHQQENPIGAVAYQHDRPFDSCHVYVLFLLDAESHLGVQEKLSTHLSNSLAFVD